MRADKSAARRKDGELSVSTLRAEMTPYLRAAGFDPNDTAGAAMLIRAEDAAIRWHDAYVAQNQKAPTAAERSAFLRSAITTTVKIDPPGLGNEKSGSNFSINYDGAPVNVNGKVVRDTPITIEGMIDPNTTFELNGIAVPKGDVQAAIEAFIERRGFEPHPQEVVNMLIATGEYN